MIQPVGAHEPRVKRDKGKPFICDVDNDAIFTYRIEMCFASTKRVTMKRFLFICLSTLTLTACGGGGASSVTDVPGIKAPAAVTAVSAN